MRPKVEGYMPLGPIGPFLNLQLYDVLLVIESYTLRCRFFTRPLWRGFPMYIAAAGPAHPFGVERCTNNNNNKSIVNPITVGT